MVRGNKGWGRKLADDVLAEAATGGVPRSQTAGWLSKWLDPVESNEMFGRWERGELEARFSEHPPEEVAKWLNQAAKDIVALGVEAAVDRLVDHIYPKLISNQPPSEL